MLFDLSSETKTGAYSPGPTPTLTPSSQAAAHSDLVFFNLREELTDEFNHFEPSAPSFEKLEKGFLVSRLSQDGPRKEKKTMPVKTSFSGSRIWSRSSASKPLESLIAET